MQTDRVSLRLLSGSLSLTDPTATSTIDSFDLAGGTLKGPGTLDVSGGMFWTGGTMAEAGITRLKTGSVNTIAPGPDATVSLDSRTLTNDGQLTLANGTLLARNAATVLNRNLLTTNSEGAPGWGQTFVNYSGAPSRLLNTNTGTLAKSTGTGSTKVGIQIDNQGAVDIQTGNMTFTAGGIPALIEDGLDIGDPSLCPLPVNTQRGSWSANTTTNAAVSFTAGCQAIGGTVDGRLNNQGANLLIDSIQGPVANLAASSGTLAFLNPAAPSTAQTLYMTGTVTGPGDLVVCGSLTWQAGTMSGTGTTEICPSGTGTINPPGGSLILTQRTLTNRGNLTWSSGAVSGSRGARLINTGTLHANSESGRLSYTGTGMLPLLKNHGTIQKDAGSGTTGIDFGVGPRGNILINTGNLVLGGTFNPRTLLNNSRDNPEDPEDILMPGGQPIGTPRPGSDPLIREVPGGETAAEDIFFRLAIGGQENTPEDYDGIGATIPEGFVGIRPESSSGAPAVDINIPGIPIRKIHFGS